MKININKHKAWCNKCGSKTYWYALSDFSYGSFLVYDEHYLPKMIWACLLDEQLIIEVDKILSENGVVEGDESYGKNFSDLVIKVSDVKKERMLTINSIPFCVSCNTHSLDFSYENVEQETFDLDVLTFHNWNKLSVVKQNDRLKKLLGLVK